MKDEVLKWLQVRPGASFGVTVGTLAFPLIASRVQLDWMQWKWWCWGGLTIFCGGFMGHLWDVWREGILHSRRKEDHERGMAERAKQYEHEENKARIDAEHLENMERMKFKQADKERKEEEQEQAKDKERETVLSGIRDNLGRKSVLATYKQKGDPSITWHTGHWDLNGKVNGPILAGMAAEGLIRKIGDWKDRNQEYIITYKVESWLWELVKKDPTLTAGGRILNPEEGPATGRVISEYNPFERM